MPISDALRRAPLLAVLVLAGCLPPPELTQRGRLSPVPVRAMKVAGSDVVIAGPAGYCIDRSTARDRSDGAFALLGRCAVLGGDVVDDGAAVLSAAVSPRSELPQRPDAAQLERFFRTRQGQAALARDGRADSVTLLTLRRDGDVLYMRVRDTSDTAPVGLDPVSWRAVFALQGRLVSLTAAHHEDLPVSDRALRQKLDGFVAAMQAANADADTEDDT